MWANLTTAVAQLPGMGFLRRRIQRRQWQQTLASSSTSEVFAEIYRRNKWGSEQSVSGSGSELIQTRRLIELLPMLFEQFQVRSLLDVPSGDFNWMSHVDLDGIDYLGGDIVDDIVERNQSHHQRPGVRFQRIDLLSDSLPRADLVLCRDCLVHFSSQDVRRALGNIFRSGATYLLTTTFPNCQQNREILTGQWRPLNLQAAPIRLPSPQELFNEGCTERNGRYADKSLGLWRVADLEAAIR